VTRFRAEDGSRVQVFETLGAGSIGVGLDHERRVWLVNEGSSTATRLDPETGEQREFPVASRPYTYSDFTGFGLSTVVRPNGFWRGLIEGCATEDGITAWATLDWTEIEPPGTSIRLRVRTAATIAELDAAIWYGPWDDSPVDLIAQGVPAGRFLQLEVQLSTSDPGETPSFLGFNVGFTCPGAPPVD
jgi:hypothetical protein